MTRFTVAFDEFPVGGRGSREALRDADAPIAQRLDHLAQRRVLPSDERHVH